MHQLENDILVVLQLFVGRVAMLGFAAELIGEELTGETPHPFVL